MSYSDITGHASMAFDATRNAVYERAIRKYVTPDSVVLDLGAGLGTLGMLAAKAGARRVFLVEPESVVLAAEEVAKRNGLGDRVQAFRGRIEDIELPEKVDVIISVFTGNLLFSEDLLPSLYYARDRWLKPGGALIPDAAQLMLAPVSAPRTHEELIGQWSSHMGIDFSCLRRFAANNTAHYRSNRLNAELLSSPTVVVDLELSNCNTDALAVDTECHALDSGRCSGLLAWIRIHLGDQWLGTGPTDRDVHWTPGFLPVDPELDVRQGEILSISLSRPAGGEWTWKIGTCEDQRRQSTFLGQPHSLSDLRKLAADFSPRRSDLGDVANFVLNTFNGAVTIDEIVDAVLTQYPSSFSRRHLALEFVRELSARYSS